MIGAVRVCVPRRMVELVFYALGKGCMIHWLWLNDIGFGGGFMNNFGMFWGLVFWWFGCWCLYCLFTISRCIVLCALGIVLICVCVYCFSVCMSVWIMRHFKAL